MNKSTPRGFEPLRAEPIGFLVHLLNHSDTMSSASAILIYFNGKFLINFQESKKSIENATRWTFTLTKINIDLWFLERLVLRLVRVLANEVKTFILCQ